MNNLRISLVVIFVVFFNMQFSNAQKKDSLMYQAYLLSSESLWESALNQYSSDLWSLDKAVAYYGLLNNTMIHSNEDKFDEYVEQALDYLETMEEKGLHTAEAIAMRSSIYGFIMAYYPWKGMYYGPKSSNAIEKALKTNTESSIVNMVLGISLFYTPESFGGNKQAAVEAFQKSVDLYEEQGYNGWLYLNTLANLGKAHQAVGQNQEAINVYEKALAVEPNFKWVSRKLLPDAKRSK
ncbi:tetratricopeptide repeat protein [Marivirga arenosa]|uniref:Tetratricopeptide repeat protein n=1 Tax=Marivirga arenosa TaxID=3059076 RepID=A0AA52F0P3_9BACT|nr:tetratricopeptide repeat protein [Marivirga sp. BKB1-2]WNB18368.1 tetratricopeptide repeat protein [Marivirga sp. BKB1-2]